MFFNSSAALYLCLIPSFSVLKFHSQNKQRSIKHTTRNIVIQPSDRFVCRSYMSQQLILIPLTAMLCLGVHFPLITWLRDETGGEGWESKCDRDFLKSGRLWTAGPPVRVSRQGWNFSPRKMRVINDLASRNNLSVCFLSCLFFLSHLLRPGPSSPLTGPGMMANVIMSKYFTANSLHSV